jgi:hypothetical protein
LSIKVNDPVAPAQRRRHSTLVLVLLWTTSVLAILIIAGFITANILLHRVSPMLKAKVVETLSTRFDSRVELDTFHVYFIRGFEVSGAGLKLYPNHLDSNYPLIQVDHFSFHAYDWRQLLQTPMFINRVQVSGLYIHLPPKNAHPGNQPQQPIQKPGEDKSHGKIKILVGEIDVDRAGLLIENGKPNKVPLNFIIQKVTLNSVAAGQPLKFHAILTNPRPTGDIDSTGDFGPFNAESPGDTPVSGQYTFRHADLGTIKGIGGILSSDGAYQGQLSHIVVDGATTTPDFRLDIAKRPMPLNTKFHAIVDGTNGDTYLQPVDAWLEQTHIIAQGEVVHTAGIPGRDVRLDLTVDPGRIQDMLLLAVKAQPPLMTGQILVHAKMDLPPGQASVTDRLRIQGSFELTGAHFTSDKITSKVDELSLRGQGKAEQANQEGAAMKKGAPQNAPPPNQAQTNQAQANQTQTTAPQSTPPAPAAQNQNQTQTQNPTANIPADMRGTFAFASSKLTIPTLDFRVPGADIALQGSYTLNGQVLDFTGTARLDAHVSQMVTGWKSWLLKPVDPFFAKDGAGTLVPIRITGTASHPEIGLNFKH